VRRVISSSAHAKLQVSVCSGFDLCHSGYFPDTHTDSKVTSLCDKLGQLS